MQVAVLGLGEAGGRIAADLAEAGCTVRGWDPVRRPEGLVNAASDREAVRGADVVLSINAASDDDAPRVSSIPNMCPPESIGTGAPIRSPA